MLYDALFTVATPSTWGPPLPTPFWDAVERFVFTGRAQRRMATCTRAPASILAGAYAALREAAAGAERPRLTVTDDADEVMNLGAVPDSDKIFPERFAEALPPRWTQEPSAFGLMAAWEEGGFAQVVRMRHTPRHDAEQTAITGSLRVLWVPEAGGKRLALRLASPPDASELHRRLLAQGERVAHHVFGRLQDALTWPVSHRARVVALVGERFDDLLHGFPDAAREAVPEITKVIRGRWPALSSQGVPGQLRGGRFEPMAGVADVV